jgi:hypothetical protein
VPVSIAATGLLLMMVSAVVTHVRRREPATVAPSAVLGLLSLVVPGLRFGPYAFRASSFAIRGVWPSVHVGHL